MATSVKPAFRPTFLVGEHVIVKHVADHRWGGKRGEIVAVYPSDNYSVRFSGDSTARTFMQTELERAPK